MQQEWNGMSFWNSGLTYHSAGVAILFSENFKGKIQNSQRLRKQNYYNYIYIEQAKFPYYYTVVRINLIIRKISFNH